MRYRYKFARSFEGGYVYVKGFCIYRSVVYSLKVKCLCCEVEGHSYKSLYMKLTHLSN